MPLHVSSTCALHQEVKIALHSLWYHQTYRWPSRERGIYQDQDVTETELPDPARKLSANLYDIYHCCVYSEKLLMMDRGTVRNM